LFLGATVDAEPDGQPSANAQGDDHDAHGDDEDGVQFTSALRQGQIATVRVTASRAGRLDAFFDFNADGDFADPGEKIFDSVPLAAGVNNLSFVVPASAVSAPTYARFRLSSAGGLSFDGPALDGEVEDYRVTLGLLLTSTLWAPGQYQWDVFNATPGGVVTFVYATHLGTLPLSQFHVTLGVTDPVYFAQGVADITGHAEALFGAPPALWGQTLEFQAFEQAPHPQPSNTVSSDLRAPLVLSIARAGSTPTAAASVQFVVTFRDNVSGVNATDFALATSQLTGEKITAVSGSGTTYAVTVDTGTGNGTLGLNFLDDDTLAAATGINLGLTRVGAFVGPTYTLFKQREDVDHSGAVAPLDVLLVINYLNRDPSTPAAVVSAAEAEAVEPPTYDVNADGHVTPLDVLLVIDYLNLRSHSLGSLGWQGLPQVSDTPVPAWADQPGDSRGSSAWGAAPSEWDAKLPELESVLTDVVADVFQGWQRRVDNA
jgi:hypothetical protein